MNRTRNLIIVSILLAWIALCVIGAMATMVLLGD